jgi:hypothetical protein
MGKFKNHRASESPLPDNSDEEWVVVFRSFHFQIFYRKPSLPASNGALQTNGSDCAMLNSNPGGRLRDWFSYS